MDWSPRECLDDDRVSDLGQCLLLGLPCKFENPRQFEDSEHLNKALKALVILLLILLVLVQGGDHGGGGGGVLVPHGGRGGG